MASVLLIYPFFLPRRDRSVFRFPPLGILYIASSLQQAGHEVRLLDCTFLTEAKAMANALAEPADVVGIYCMVTLFDQTIRFARALRPHCHMLVAGGPLPTCDPQAFAHDFDVIVRGEGEQTMVDLLSALETNCGPAGVPGIAFHQSSGEPDSSPLIFTPERKFNQRLDEIPFPAREMLENTHYINYGKKKYGDSITTVMSTRGCPYRCEFCSNVVFGGSFRERTPQNVVDEIEACLAMGYDRISFADDVFTMKKERVLNVCREITRRELNFHWECLGRVDALDFATALEMKKAGCTRIYFGIESGSVETLALMNKKITPEQAKAAVLAAHQAGLEVGAFFIVCYPGDTDDSVIETLHFAASLPLDYLGLSMPYPLPGTALHERVKDRIQRDWHQNEAPFTSHVLIFDAESSALKMNFAIIKGHIQHRINRYTGRAARWLLPLFEKPSDWLFRIMK